MTLTEADGMERRRSVGVSFMSATAPRATANSKTPLIERLGTFGFALDHNGRPIAEDFGKAVHELSGVVAHGDNCISTVLVGVLAHQLICFFASLLAQQRNVDLRKSIQF